MKLVLRRKKPIRKMKDNLINKILQEGEESLQLYDKVNVLTTISPMSTKQKVFTLTVCRIEKDENGDTFYAGKDERGKVKYFRKENIVNGR